MVINDMLMSFVIGYQLYKKPFAMYHPNLKYYAMLIAMAIFTLVMFSSCEDEENGNSDNGETEVWEPYDFTANTSFEYDYEYTDVSSEEVTTGTMLIEIGDPEVTISGTIDGQDINITENISSDLEDNFISAVSKTPLAPVLYQPYWTGGFSQQELRVGASWSYSYGGSSISFEVTGKDTYAGYEGFTIETIIQDDGETITMNTCVNPDLPVALMVSVEEAGGDTYWVEMTNYED